MGAILEAKILNTNNKCFNLIKKGRKEEWSKGNKLWTIKI